MQADFSNIEPEAMDAANNIMDQLRQQGWKPPHEREPGETGPWDDGEAVGAGGEGVEDAEVVEAKPSGLPPPPPPGDLPPTKE